MPGRRARGNSGDEDERYAEERWPADGFGDGRADDDFAADGREDEWSAQGRALMPRQGERELDVYQARERVPTIIPGTGISMGNPFIRRRERPLSMRLAIITLMASMLVTSLFAATPISSSADQPVSSFQALSGAVLFQQDTGYTWYTVSWGENVETVARKFGVQIGGIYKLNDLLAGQELTVGQAYKVPNDRTYGADYRPRSYIQSSAAYGQTTFGSTPWSSMAGTPLPEAACGPDGHGNPLGYKLRAPNWGAGFVRGFSWYHNGDDLAAPNGNPIHAAQAGQVIWAGWDVNGLGFSVKINHCNHISTAYGHMAKVLVRVGQNVDVGDVIGLEGSTGWSTGPHLHFMVMWDNQPQEALNYYPSMYALLNNVP